MRYFFLNLSSASARSQDGLILLTKIWLEPFQTWSKTIVFVARPLFFSLFSVFIFRIIFRSAYFLFYFSVCVSLHFSLHFSAVICVLFFSLFSVIKTRKQTEKVQCFSFFFSKFVGFSPGREMLGRILKAYTVYNQKVNCHHFFCWILVSRLVTPKAWDFWLLQHSKCISFRLIYRWQFF